MMSDLIKSGEVIKREDGKVLLKDSLNPEYTKEHKIAHYRYLAGVTKVKPKVPIAIDEIKVADKAEIRRVLQEREERLKEKLCLKCINLTGRLSSIVCLLFNMKLITFNDGVRSSDGGPIISLTAY
jgi:hypothetical protein